MQRRDFLVLGSTVLASTSGPVVHARPNAPIAGKRVTVIGAGIIGASIAHRLAVRGAQVTLIDRARPGGGGTQGSFAWIMPRPVAGSPSLYDLYVAAVHGWRWLDSEFNGALAMRWGGYVGWRRPGADADAFAASVRQQLAWGAGTRLIDRDDLRALVPGMTVDGEIAAAVYAEDSGSVDPARAVALLIAEGRAAGLKILSGCAVTGFETSGGVVRALKTSQGLIETDTVVLAAGADTPRLAAMVGVKTPVNVMAGSLAHSSPAPLVLDRAIAAPDAVIKQDAGGRFVTGPAFGGAPSADTSEAYGRQLLANAAEVYPLLRSVGLERMTVGNVAVPTDAKPIVGFCAEPANLYVALTLSGVTFAPLFGRLVATEILDDTVVTRLDDYRPARFA